MFAWSTIRSLTPGPQGTFDATVLVAISVGVSVTIGWWGMVVSGQVLLVKETISFSICVKNVFCVANIFSTTFSSVELFLDTSLLSRPLRSLYHSIWYPLSLSLSSSRALRSARSLAWTALCEENWLSYYYNPPKCCEPCESSDISGLGGFTKGLGMAC